MSQSPHPEAMSQSPHLEAKSQSPRPASMPVSSWFLCTLEIEGFDPFGEYSGIELCDIWDTGPKTPNEKPPKLPPIPSPPMLFTSPKTSTRSSTVTGTSNWIIFFPFPLVIRGDSETETMTEFVDMSDVRSEFSESSTSGRRGFQFGLKSDTFFMNLVWNLRFFVYF